jgi:hypothetical protein
MKDIIGKRFREIVILIILIKITYILTPLFAEN